MKANAGFSALSGVAFLVGAKPIAAFLDITAPAVLTVAGILLLIFAGDLFFLATRKTVNPKYVWAVIAADVLWVMGSIILLVTDLVPFTVAGKWAVGIVAAIVAVFAEIAILRLEEDERG